MKHKPPLSAIPIKRQQLIHCLKDYEKNEVIHDSLIPYYDQHGKWRGDTLLWREDAIKKLIASMQKSHLPEPRRTMKSRMGPILLTSWVASAEESVMVKYVEIRGSLIAYNSQPIVAASLRYIAGDFSASTSNRIDFPNLVRVEGNCEAAASFRLHAPRLRSVGGRLKLSGELPPRLESVGRSLSTFWLFEFVAPNLKHVGGTLIPHKAETVHAPLLETIGGGFLVSDRTEKIEVPMLSSIGDDFLATHTTDIRAYRLRAIGGDMDTRSAKEFYHPAIRVGGDWTCDPDAIHHWVIREKARQALRYHCDLLEL